MPIPPTPYAFASIAHIESRADRVGPGTLAPSLARGEGYLGFTRNGWQETLGVHMTSGAPEQLIVLPRATYLPLFIALTTAGVVLGFLFKLYLLSLVLTLVVAGLFVLGGQSAGLARDYGPLPVGRGLSLPPHTEVADSPSWWALIFTLVIDATLFTSLVFGTLYLWIAAPNWPPPARPEPNLLLIIAALAALVVAAFTARGSLRAGAAGGAPQGWIGLTMLALVAAIAAVVVLISGVIPNPREHALGATAAALLAFVVLARRHRCAVSDQQLPAHRCGIRIAAAAHRPAPDAAVDRLHRGDCGHRARPRAGAARSCRRCWSPAMSAAASSARRDAGSITARAVPPRYLWWLAAGFGVWASALVMLYALHAIGCAFAWPAGSLRLVIAVVLLAHLIVIGWMWRDLARADPDPAFGVPGTFLRTVFLWTSIAAFVTTALTLGPALLLTVCV